MDALSDIDSYSRPFHFSFFISLLATCSTSNRTKFVEAKPGFGLADLAPQQQRQAATSSDKHQQQAAAADGST